MTKETKDDVRIDDLLRRALADDLPAEVEAGMRRRIERFREAKSGSETAPRPWGAAARAWLFRRSVWAALSVLMLVAGLLLQGRKPWSPLAEKIAAIKIEYASLDTTRR